MVPLNSAACLTLPCEVSQSFATDSLSSHFKIAFLCLLLSVFLSLFLFFSFLCLVPLAFKIFLFVSFY